MATTTWGSALEIVTIAQPGDLIEFNRLGYKHWGVYIGDGKVIHVFLEAKGVNEKSAEIKEETLVKVCGKDKCRINNLTDEAKSKGLEALSSDLIILNAKMHVGNENKYKLFSDNCEFFATSCRYGRSFCQQIDSTINSLDKLTLGCAVIGGLAAASRLLIKWSQRSGERMERPYETANMTRANQLNQ